jgi:thiamine biosynthesis protein ThiS
MMSEADDSARVPVMLNGTDSFVVRGTTIARLLDQLGVVSDRVAVEVNLSVVDRTAYDRTVLREGDRVEIVSFVGGGHG